jgi:ADP-heptose:LPS heptosyltransferase
MDEKLPLRDFGALVSQSKVVISCSTGPMHLAAAQGIDTVSFFPPDAIPQISALRWGPLGNRHIIIKPGGDMSSPETAMNGIAMDEIKHAFDGITVKK